MSSTIQLSPASRAEHVGSLLRPQILKETKERYEAGQCTAEELKAVEDAAIAEVVQFQKQLGLKTITDGEFRRYVFAVNLIFPRD